MQWFKSDISDWGKLQEHPGQHKEEDKIREKIPKDPIDRINDNT